MGSMREQLKVGSFLDSRYEVIAPLNHGSFGMVSLARDIKENELVAIKCLVKATTEGNVEYDDDAQELYYHSILGNHPYIVNVRNSFETDSHLFIVLEYCSMGDLYEAIRLDKGPLETEHVRDFMLQLISAVEYMHSKGVYHRDIKPENIFLTQEGDIKLGDFGLATTDNLSDDVCVGSDRYMAPEQYDPSNGPYDPAKADIWAIGICLLNVLFARNPFTVPTPEDPLFADFLFDRETLFDIFPTMSEQTFDVLNHCLTLDPSKRSLENLRHAIMNVTAWSTDDEMYDDYCIEDRDAQVTASTREPLRTPSITSPQVNLGGGFPWAQALNANNQQRQLSTIYDDEPYVAVPQPKKAEKSSKLQNSYDSGLGISIPSLPKKPSPFKAISYFSNSRIEIVPPKPFKLTDSKTDTKAQTTLSPVTPTFVSNASVPNIPINPSKKPISYSSKSDSGVSMSWSDIFDEDEEEEQRLAMQRLKENNSRTWSADKKMVTSTHKSFVKDKFIDEDVFGIEVDTEFDDDSEWVTGGWEDFHI